MNMRRIPDWKCTTPDELAGKAVRTFKECWKDIQTSIRRYARTNHWSTPQIHAALKKASTIWDSNSMRKYKSLPYNPDTPPELRALYMQDRKYGVSLLPHKAKWLTHLSHATLIKYYDTGLVAAVLFNQGHPSYKAYFEGHKDKWDVSDCASFYCYIEPTKSQSHARKFLEIDEDIVQEIISHRIISVAKLLDKNDTESHDNIMRLISGLRMRHEPGFWPYMDSFFQWQTPRKLIDLMHCLPTDKKVALIPVLFDHARSSEVETPTNTDNENTYIPILKYVEAILNSDQLSLAQKQSIAEKLDMLLEHDHKERRHYAWHPLIGNQIKHDDIEKLIQHMDPELLSYTLLFNTYLETSPEVGIDNSLLSESLQ